MIPAIPDTDGNEFDPTAHRLSYDQFEYRCLIEIADARAEDAAVSGLRSRASSLGLAA